MDTQYVALESPAGTLASRQMKNAMLVLEAHPAVTIRIVLVVSANLTTKNVIVEILLLGIVQLAVVQTAAGIQGALDITECQN